MKFNKAIICLIAILSISTTFATVANQTATQQWWGSNKNVKEAIATISTGAGYKFKCQLDNIEEKKDGGAAFPLGIAFNGFLQLSNFDTTGFMNYVQAAMKIENYNLNMQVLDYRLIQGCTVRDNANGGMFEKWKLMLDLHATEKYNIMANADKKGIYSWKMELELPNMGKDDVMAFKKTLINNCVKRNTQINKMKNDAIKYGLKYNTLYWDFENREQSLEQQAALVKSEKQVVEKVKAEQTAKKVEIDTAIAANKELLDSTITGLKEAATIKDNTEEAIESLATKLTTFQVKLTFFNDQQQRISVNIQNSKRQISDAKALLDIKLTDKEKLDKENAKIAAATAADKAAFDAALEKIRKQQEKVEAEKTANEAARAAEDAANAKASAANSKNIESVQGQIAKLEEKIKSAESLVADYQTQSISIQIIITQLTKTVEQKRSVAATINAQIKDLEREQADQAARLTAIAANGDKDIAAIKQRLTDQVKSVKFETDKLKEEAEYYITQAAGDIAKAKKDFEDSIVSINKMAASVSLVTIDATRNVLSNPGCESHINMVVASQPYVIKMALLRLAKTNKQAKALNEARFAQMQRVRMQRKSLKNKLRHHKNTQ